MYKVIIADDEPIERLVLEKTLNKLFPGELIIYKVQNGREAVECFDENKCDMAIMDIEMPGLNGLEAAKLIREKDKNCSIIFLTAFNYFSYAKEAISVRALDYLLKPYNDSELAAVVESAMLIADDNRSKELSVSNGLNAACADGCESVLNDGESGNNNLTAEQRIKAYVDEHYVDDLSLQSVADAMNYSDVYFCKLFKQYFGVNFTAYLADYRINKAKQLLADVTINVKEISIRVGYRDSNYFAKVFKRAEGMSPSEYRAKIIGGN